MQPERKPDVPPERASGDSVKKAEETVLANSRCPNGHLVPDGTPLCPACGTLVDSSVPTPPPQAVLPQVSGYELLEELGRGGMGVVYKARHLRLNRIVALKMILAGEFAAVEIRQRFQREAEAVARLQHPNVVQVHEIGEAGGKAFFSLEFVDGASLADRLRGTPLPPKQAALLLLVLAKAVHCAHEQGIVHRDLKPGNILIAGHGALPADQWTPKIADFGLAKQLHNEGTQHTRSGAILGTPSYMAPEQARGEIDRIGPATDVYALGAILYELLTGRPPFVAPSAYDTIAQVLHAEPLPVRGLQATVPRDLETICLKCLHKESAKRYGSAKELAEDLHRFLDGAPIHARPTGLGERVVKWVRRRPAVAALWIGGLLALAGALIGYGIYEHRLQSTRGETQAAALVKSLATTETRNVPHIIAQLEPLRVWADPALRKVLADSPDDKSRLHASLALLPVDPGQVEYLAGQLLRAAPDVTPVLCQSLRGHGPLLTPALWTKMLDARGDAEERLRIACALAFFAPADARWAEVAPFIADRLLIAVQRNPSHYSEFVKTLHPLGARLVPALTVVFKQSDRSQADRSFAAHFLAEFASDQPAVLADLLMDADDKQFAILFPVATGGSPEERKAVAGILSAEIDKQILDQKIFMANGTIAEGDAKVKTRNGLLPAKRFEVPLQAGKMYRLTLDGADLGPCLVIQDKAGNVLAYDDDRGGSLNSLLPVSIPKDENYTVFAASFKGVGSFTLTIVEMFTEDDGKEKLAKRQANAALVLLKMDQPTKVWPLLKHSPDPRVRSYLIHRFGPLGANPMALVKRWDEELDLTIRRALILSLGDFDEIAFPAEERKPVTAKLQDLYQTAVDPGLHAAAEWLLRTWKQEQWLQQVNERWAKDDQQRVRLEAIKEMLAKEKEKTPPQWYVNGQGQSMVVLPGPMKFLMGSPPTEKGRFATETLHRMRIGRTFALAAKPVTVAEYRRFNKSHFFTERYSPTPDCPVVSTSWYEAAAYCNWLSEQEGIPPEQWCYEIDPKGQVTRLREKYLNLPSYRLPTEAEMEYAARAGAVTSRYYGETEELLPSYGWYVQNSADRTWPVGSKKPNDLGLFDMHGNVWNWCQERLLKSGRPVDDLEDPLLISPQENRVVRGGSFIVRPWNMRSANFDWNVPTLKNIFIGFRVAKTLTP